MEAMNVICTVNGITLEGWPIKVGSTYSLEPVSPVKLAEYLFYAKYDYGYKYEEEHSISESERNEIIANIASKETTVDNAKSIYLVKGIFDRVENGKKCRMIAQYMTKDYVNGHFKIV